MKILVFVAKTTGYECLKWLLENNKNDSYEIFVANPDKELITGYLDKKGFAYHDLETADPAQITENQQYNWLINIWSPYIFRKSLLERVDHSVNLHPSYLPYGRGRDPVVWAIQDNVFAGATLHELTEGIDEGPIWAQTKVEYHFPETGQDVYERVEKACIELFCDNWNALIEQKLSLKEQGMPELPTRRRKDLLHDRTLSMDDSETATFVRKIIAHDFSENGYTALLRSGEKAYSVVLKLEEIDEE